MDKRRTPESLFAHSVFESVKNLPRPFRISFNAEGRNEKLVRETLRKLMRDKREFDDVSTSILPGSVTVFSKDTKIKSRETRLIEMVRRLAMHVDNESLYEEALALVKSI